MTVPLTADDADVSLSCSRPTLFLGLVVAGSYLSVVSLRRGRAISASRDRHTFQLFKKKRRSK